MRNKIFLLIFILFARHVCAKEQFLLVKSPVADIVDKYILGEIKKNSVKVILKISEYQILLSDAERVESKKVVVDSLAMNILGTKTFELIFTINDSNGNVKKIAKKKGVKKEDLIVESTKTLIRLFLDRISNENRKLISSISTSVVNKTFIDYVKNGKTALASNKQDGRSGSNGGFSGASTGSSGQDDDSSANQQKNSRESGKFVSPNQSGEDAVNNGKNAERNDARLSRGKNGASSKEKGSDVMSLKGNGESFDESDRLEKERLIVADYYANRFLYKYQMNIRYMHQNTTTKDIIQAKNSITYLGGGAKFFVPVDYSKKNGLQLSAELLSPVTGSKFDIPFDLKTGGAFRYFYTRALSFFFGISFERTSFINLENENSGEILGVNRYLWADVGATFDVEVMGVALRVSPVFSKIITGASDYGEKGKDMGIGGFALGTALGINLYKGLNLIIEGTRSMISSSNYSEFEINSNVLTVAMGYNFK